MRTAIIKYRQKNNLTQQALANLVGTTQTNISLVERGFCPCTEWFGRLVLLVASGKM